MIPVYERAKRVHAFDRATTEIGGFIHYRSDRGTSPSQYTRNTVPPVSTETDFISVQTAGKHSVILKCCVLFALTSGLPPHKQAQYTGISDVSEEGSASIFTILRDLIAKKIITHHRAVEPNVEQVKRFFSVN